MIKLVATVISLSLSVLLASITYTFAKPVTEKNISYGNLERQKYDQYVPQDINPNTPILFFIYGGSWDSGDKSKYAFVGKTFSKEGFITIIPDYRLFPEVTFPAFIGDTALAFAKVRAKYPSRKIFVSGHSAGAQIGALMTLDKKYLGQHSLSPCSSIAGFIGLAGPYDFEVTEEKFKQIFPQATRTQSQAINFANSKAPAMLLLHGSLDTTVHAEDSTILARKLEAAGNSPEVKLYKGVSHINIVAALSPLLGILAPTKSDMIKFMNEKTDQASTC